jgi:uracil phosphoribosyltransferase
LNVFDTQISDSGIQALAKLKSLKNIYCWKSKVTKTGIQALKKALPEVAIHTGWEETTKISTKE